MRYLITLSLLSVFVSFPVLSFFYFPLSFPFHATQTKSSVEHYELFQWGLGKTQTDTELGAISQSNLASGESEFCDKLCL